MKRTLFILMMSVMLVFTMMPLAQQAHAFSAESFKATITKVAIGAPQEGENGTKVLPVDVFFTADENLGDESIVTALEGKLKATLSFGTQADGIKGLGMTLQKILEGLPTASNTYSWDDSTKTGVLRYNIPIIENGHDQVIEFNEGTGLDEANGLMAGDTLSLQIITELNVPEGVASSAASKAESITIEEFTNYPKVISFEKPVAPVRFDNTMDLKGKTYKVSYKKLKKKGRAIGLAKYVNVKAKGEGDKTYKILKIKKGKKYGYSKYFKVNKATGTLKVKKGAKKGTYKITLQVVARGDKTHKSAVQNVTSVIKIK